MSSRAEVESFYGRGCFLETLGAIEWGSGRFCSGLLDEGIYRTSGARNNLLYFCPSTFLERAGR